MIEVIPGILEKDLEVIEQKIKLVRPYAEWVQIDVADTTLVPNETFLDFSKFEKYAQDVSLEAHLMVVHPERYIKMLADAGFKRLIAHIEAADPRLFLNDAQYESVEIGVAIDGATEFEQVEPFLDAVDTVLVMTVEAGYSGQPFLPETVEKIRTIHQNLPDLPIEVDGGINPQTAKIVKEAGATRLVSTSFLFKNPSHVREAIDQLQNS